MITSWHRNGARMFDGLFEPIKFLLLAGFAALLCVLGWAILLLAKIPARIKSFLISATILTLFMIIWVDWNTSAGWLTYQIFSTALPVLCGNWIGGRWVQRRSP